MTKTNETVQDPITPKYDRTSGLLTDYGRSLGLKEVNDPNKVITSDNLKNTGSGYKLPDNTPSTGATGLQEFIGTTTSSAKAEADRLRAERETAQSTKKTDLNKTIKDIMGLNSDISTAGSEIDRTAEDAAHKQADEYTSQIEAEQLSNRRKLEKFQKENPTGMLSSGIAIESERINRESVSKQADLAILQSAATRRYETANAIADRQLALKLEPLKAKLENLKFFYEQNKADFSKEDDRLYAEAVKKADAELTKQTGVETTIKDIKVSLAQSGAATPALLSALSAIDTSKPGAIDEVIKLAGKNMANTNAEFQKIGDNLVRIDKATGKILNNYGSGSGDPSPVPSSVVRTVTTKEGDTKIVSGYTLAAGDDPYVLAHQLGTDMDMMKKLNPTIQDWTKLKPGTVLNVPSKDDTWLSGKSAKQVASYNSLPDAEKAGIKQLVNGDILLADYVKSRGKNTKAQIDDVITKATAIDPNFSVNQNKIKYNANLKWNDPNAASFKNRSAINTALSHMGTTYKSALALGNTTLPKYNDISNWVSKHTGDPKLTNFVYDLQTLSSEIAAAYKGGNSAPTEKEIENFYNSMSGGMSPAQFKGVFNEASKLMSGKLRSLSTEYKSSTGSYPNDPIIQPTTLDELRNSGVDVTPMETILKEQGYDVPNTDPDTSLLNNFLSGGVKDPTTATLDKLWK